MAVVMTLAAPKARLILSLRHGPAAPGRQAWPCPPEKVIAMAEAAGLRVVQQTDRHSIQTGNRAAGVTWTWLVLEAP